MPNLYVTEYVRLKLEVLCKQENRALCDEIDFLVHERIRVLGLNRNELDLPGAAGATPE